MLSVVCDYLIAMMCKDGTFGPFVLIQYFLIVYVDLHDFLEMYSSFYVFTFFY